MEQNMAGKLSYTVEGQLVRVQTGGDFTVDAFLDIIQEALNSPKASENISILLDSRKATTTRTDEDIQRIMDYLVSHVVRIQSFAYVTLSKRLFEAVQKANKYAEYNKWGNVGAFMDIESALIWINERIAQQS